MLVLQHIDHSLSSGPNLIVRSFSIPILLQYDKNRMLRKQKN